MRGSGAEQRLLRGCSGAVALRAVCPAQITAGVPDYAVGPQVAEKPVVPVGRDLGHRARPPASLAAAQFVIRNASGREVLDLSKHTVTVVCIMYESITRYVYKFVLLATTFLTEGLLNGDIEFV